MQLNHQSPIWGGHLLKKNLLFVNGKFFCQICGHQQFSATRNLSKPQSTLQHVSPIRCWKKCQIVSFMYRNMMFSRMTGRLWMLDLRRSAPRQNIHYGKVKVFILAFTFYYSGCFHGELFFSRPFYGLKCFTKATAYIEEYIDNMQDYVWNLHAEF